MSPGAARRLRIQLLGQAGWQTELAAGHLSSKFAALVAVVAVGGRQARDTVARQLWPGDLARARDNLRQHVTRLRRVTGHAVFVQDESIELATGVDCDVFGSPAEWPLPQLLAAQPLLAGMAYPDLHALQVWIDLHRERWQARIADALVQRSISLENTQDAISALALVGRATELAPWLESAWRARMRLHYLAADHAAAARAYSQLQTQLALVHTLPSAETLALWRTIERGGAAPVRPTMIPASLLRPPVLIGRERHWAAMQGAWQLRQPFLLRGEAGIGKTRLLLDFVRQAGSAVVVAGRKGDALAPYSTLGTLLRALIDQQGLVLDPWVQRAVTRLIPEAPTPLDGPPADQIVLWRAVDTLLQQAAESGVRSITLDDLHFADVASLEAWRWLAAGPSAQVLHFGFATRPMADSPQQALVQDWLTDSARPHLVDLPALTLDELTRLLETLDLAGAPARVTAQALHSHAGGQPYLALETLKEVLLKPTDATKAGLPTPSNAVPLLQRRVLAVPAFAQPLLRLTAVLGIDLHHGPAALGRTPAEHMAMAAALEAHGVLRDGQFVHDLMRTAVLDSLAPDKWPHWHGVAAAALESDARVPRARVAHHWAAARRWPQAASAYRAAGRDARDAGRLPESALLFEEAANCSHLAGDRAAEFEAVHDHFEANCDRLSPAESTKLVERLATLACLPEQQVRVAIADAHVAFVKLDRGPAVLARASRAVAQATPFEHLRGEALNLQGLALVQMGHHEEALASCRQAVDLAQDQGQTRKAQEWQANLAYVCYAAGRIGEAITLNRALLDEFEAAGDTASAGQVEGNLANLVLLAGLPAQALSAAERARQRLRVMQAGPGNPLVVLNAVALGSALIHAGRFEEALALLTPARDHLAEAPAPTQIKVRLTLAHLWLLLGDSAQALAALEVDDSPWPEAISTQLSWIRAQAAMIDGQTPQAALAPVGARRRDHWQAPLSQAPWLEWSRQGDAAEVAQQMARVAVQYEQAGMPGMARSAVLRRIHRLCEINDRDAVETAATLARGLRPVMGEGLQATTYMPEAWQILAQALERAGDQSAADACLADGRRWITETALPHVPAPWETSFLQRNPVNRRLCGSG